MAITAKKNTGSFSMAIKQSLGQNEIDGIGHPAELEAPDPIPVALEPSVQAQGKRPKLKDRAVSLKVNGKVWDSFKTYAEMNGSTANGMLTQLIATYVFEQKKKYGGS